MSWDKAAWIEKKIAEKNRLKAKLPVIETNLGKDKFGDCVVEWIVRERTKTGKASKLIQSMLKKAKSNEQMRLL